MAVALSDVFAIELDSQPGRAADTLKLFSDASLSVIYMYSFLFHGRGLLIFRTDNADRAEEIIRRASLNSLTESDLSKWE